jgi:RND family efflux transporter MFP subunit
VEKRRSMKRKYCCSLSGFSTWVATLVFVLVGSVLHAEEAGQQPQGAPPSPVQVAPVVEEMVSDQVTLIGTTEPIARSMIAAEVSGSVKEYPVREGDFVKKGQVLARLRSTNLELRLKAAGATREKVLSNLVFAEKELDRYTRLKKTDSIAESSYDKALDAYRSLKSELLRTEAEIEVLKDDIRNKTVVAPFAGFIAEEHTQVGEWIDVGGPVVTLVDLGHLWITVDVPERYAIQLSQDSPVRVTVTSLSNETFSGKISAVFPEGDMNARTFPVRVELANPDVKIRSGMEATATFSLGTKRKALLVPKDAIVTAGTNRMVYVVASGVAQPAPVEVLGYYDGNVAVKGSLQPGTPVVIRGNERLRPGQPVQIME